MVLVYPPGRVGCKGVVVVYRYHGGLFRFFYFLFVPNMTRLPKVQRGFTGGNE